jgi:hypothetical protein
MKDEGGRMRMKQRMKDEGGRMTVTLILHPSSFILRQTEEARR